jgi:hypothetical protein
LKNTNLDLNYEDFDKYNSEEIVGFVERNVVRSIAVKDGKLVIEAGGSDSAYALIERKVNLIINNFEKLLSSLTHGSGDNALIGKSKNHGQKRILNFLINFLLRKEYFMRIICLQSLK